MVKKVVGLFLMSPLVTVLGAVFLTKKSSSKEEIISALITVAITWLAFIGWCLFIDKD